MNKSPLRHFPLCRTPDIHSLQNILADWGIDDYAIEDRNYQYYIDLVTLRDIALTYGSCSSRVRMNFSGVGFMRHRICVAGTGQSTAGRFSYNLNPHDWSALVPAGESGTLDFAPRYEELRMVVDDRLMRKKIGALIGDAPVDRIVFTPHDEVRSPALARFRRLMSFLLSELEAGGQQSPGIVVNEIADAALVSYIYGQNHNFSHLLQQQSLAPSVSQQRLAEDFIAAHWDKALSIEDIAKATNLSARSVFRSFRQTHGCSPFEYVKRVRLTRARDMLVEGDPQSTVTGVALKCGFQSLGHFARSYRATFGTLPSETLQESRR